MEWTGLTKHREHKKVLFSERLGSEGIRVVEDYLSSEQNGAGIAFSVCSTTDVILSIGRKTSARYGSRRWNECVPWSRRAIDSTKTCERRSDKAGAMRERLRGDERNFSRYYECCSPHDESRIYQLTPFSNGHLVPYGSKNDIERDSDDGHGEDFLKDRTG